MKKELMKKVILYLGDGTYREASESEKKHWYALNQKNKRKFIYTFDDYDVVNVAEVDSSRLVALYIQSINAAALTAYERLVRFVLILIALFCLGILMKVWNLSLMLENVENHLDTQDKKIEEIIQKNDELLTKFDNFSLGDNKKNNKEEKVLNTKKK